MDDTTQTPPDVEGDETAERRDEGAPDVLTSKKSSMEEPLRPGEAKIVEWVYGLYDDAVDGKRDVCDPEGWDNDLATYWGDQWPQQLPTFKPRVVVNEIKSLIGQELSDLTDSRLKVYVQKHGGATERDTAVEHAIQTYWANDFCDLTVALAGLDALIFPLGFLQTGFDPRKDQGQGRVRMKSRDPRSVFPDPDAEDDDDLRYMIFRDVLDIVQIRADWPETGWRVNPEAALSEKTDQAGGSGGPRPESRYTGPLYTRKGLGAGVPGWKKARAQVLTCTVDDDTLKQEIREIGGVLRQIKVPLYPHKRFIQIANDRVLYDDDCPFHLAPIITRVMLQLPVHAYWPAQSVVNEFAEVQSTANKSDSLVAENLLRMTAGEIFADADSGLNPKNYGGIPGMVYLIKPGSTVNKSYPNPMPPEFVSAGERFRGFIRSTMGFPLSRTGAGTHGNVAAELAETEISQAMGLTRLRGRLMYQSVQKAVEMIFARMAEFYTVPRHLPYIDGGELHSVKWEPVIRPEQYAVHVDEDAFKVRSKTMVQRLALALAKMGKMPTGRLLKILEIPDADTIAAGSKEELVLMAAARGKGQRGRK